ncbi:MAG: hypothetical protein ACRDOH_30610 [Streptosporangiaceae bacterium]
MATRPTEAAGSRSTQDPAESATSPRPRALGLAAVAQAIEAAGMCVAAAFSAIATADGRSYQLASGIALTLIAIGTAAVFAVFAAGLAKARPWTRTPVVMTQFFVIVAGIYLLIGDRLDWAVPTLLLAATCLAALFTPASLRALNRPAKPPRG